MVFGLLLVPPPGWCCYVLELTVALAPAEQGPAPTKKCCCCKETANPKPQQPKEKPGRPFTYCCPAFDKLSPDGSVRFAPDSAGLFAAVIPLLPVSGTAVLLPACHYSIVSSTALHLLHCVWLC